MKPVFLWLLVGCLSSCAPMMVTRTPEPAAPGTLDVTLSAGYPLLLTTIPACTTGLVFCSDGFFPATYYPLGSPFAVTLSQGLQGNTELNYSLSAGQPLGLPFFRFGGKTLVYDEDLKFAADYGLSLGSSSGVDAGALASLPVEGAELYGALRGFGTFYSQEAARYEGAFNLSGALTLGVTATAPGVKGLFAELTFATSSYNGFELERIDNGEAIEGIQPVGFSILPAVGIRF